MDEISDKQYWLVLTEGWCGDSAQNLPVIAGLAEATPAVDLHILLRDSHPDIMDNYLTNGGRGIPKLVAFNGSGGEIFQWGPRPQEALSLFKSMKEKDIPKADIYVELHKWYGKNKGNAVKNEILELMANGN